MNRQEKRHGDGTEFLKQAQKNAQAFTTARVKEFMTAFFHDSSFVEELYEARDETDKDLTLDEFKAQVMADYDKDFGKLIALCYALGYVDGRQGKTVQQLYLAPMKKLIVPGKDMN